MTYQMDHEARKERERLRAIEAWVDPNTIGYLKTIGVGTGWNCLELGAGGGSIAEWLCRRVGETGHVVATDLQTKFIEEINEPNLEVRKHDLRSDELEVSSFDLVHARALLEHLPEREQLMKKLVTTLKPGGWLLIESGDYLSLMAAEGDPDNLFDRAWPRFFDVLISNGMDPYYGRRLGAVLRENGLANVRLEGRVAEWGGSRPLTGIWLLMFQQFRNKVVDDGVLSAKDADEFIDLLEKPSFCAITPTVYSGWGQKPKS